MNALTFHIRLLQPLLVTQLGAGEENSSTAFAFVPGSMLRGALIGRYLRVHPVQEPVRDPTCRRLFFDGDVCYLNAYPVNRLGERTLPTPLSWRVSKDDRNNPSVTIYDFAVDWSESLDNPVVPPGSFCWREGDQVELVEPDRYVALHNASEDRRVKRKGSSTVYRYEAIAPGAVFGGVIVSQNQRDLELLWRLLEEQAELGLGRSQSAGYGRVRFDSAQIVPNWHEYERDEQLPEDIVLLTLLSDAILRDGNGQPSTDLDAVLGWKRERAYQQPRVAAGFNRTWGLPLVQMQALQAGNVFVYRAGQVDGQTVRQLEQEGIGERRAEGFGRIAVNWHTRATMQRRTVPDDFHVPSISLSEESQELARRMAQRRLRRLLDQQLVNAISRLSIAEPLPQNTQLSRLRATVHRAWREGNPDLVVDDLENLKTAKGQFVWARVSNERLSSWLIEGVQQKKIWKDWLQPSELPSLAGVVAEPTDAMKLEYIARLLDALLKKATRQERLGGGVV